MAKKEEKIYVVGHKNPDTDSICSAIAYANLKREITGNDYIAKNLGQSLLDLKRKVLDLEQYRVGYHQLESKVKEQKRDLENITDNYNRVISSRRWRIPTKLINLFRRNK